MKGLQGDAAGIPAFSSATKQTLKKDDPSMLDTSLIKYLTFAQYTALNDAVLALVRGNLLLWRAGRILDEADFFCNR